MHRLAFGFDPAAELEAAQGYVEHPHASLDDAAHDVCASTLGLPSVARIALAASRDPWDLSLLPVIDDAYARASVAASHGSDNFGCASYVLMLGKVRTAITMLRGIGPSGVGPLLPRRPAQAQKTSNVPLLPTLVPGMYAPLGTSHRGPMGRRSPPSRSPQTAQEAYVVWSGSRANHLPIAVQNALKQMFLVMAAREGIEVPWEIVAAPPIAPRASSAPSAPSFVPARGAPPIPTSPFVPPLH